LIKKQIKTDNMDDSKNQAESTASTSDAIPKVTGIGGIFFFSDNPAAT
jgi:hypothetical protein